MKKLFTPLLLLTLGAGVHAQTWTGATSSNWFTASNWNPATVPGSSDAATIPGSLSTYPTLTGNVTIAGLTMSSGSALHLAGFTFTDNGSVSLNTATVDGGGAFNVAGAGSVYVSSATLTTAVSITNVTGICNFYNNIITGNTIISDASGQATGNNSIDGNLFTGNLSLTHASATDAMYEGLGGSSGNHITGNATFNLSGAGSFYSSYSHPLQVDGNLTVNRTTAGYTNLYITPGGGIGGAFSYATSGGDSYINQSNSTNVVVGGTFNVSAPSAGLFHMYRMKNLTAGGTVSIAGATNLDIQSDTLRATVNLTGYTGVGNIYNNSVTGNTTISDAAGQATGNNSVDGNLFTGNLSLTHASATDAMYEGSGGASGNHVTGNATFNLSGAGSFYSSYSHPLQVDGNLTVNRTTAGYTNLYITPGGGIGGAFSYTSSGGDSYINQSNNMNVEVGSTFNVSAPAAGLFHMYRMKNGTAGGTVSVIGASNLDVESDTLRATVSLTGYTGVGNIYNNSFTGNTTISDAAGQATGNNNIDGNLFGGNLTVTHASATDVMYEGNGGSATGNRVTGNATFNLSGAGSFYSSYSHPLRVDGALTINRTTAGYTNLYNTPGGGTGGNFSYTTSGGDSYINQSNNTNVLTGGTFNVSAPAASLFHMYRMKNGTAGGTVSVIGASNLDVESDTLRATVSLTGYIGVGNIYNNSFTGNTTISDAAGQATGNNNIDGNLFGGNLTVTHASATDVMYEGNGGSATGNRVTGNATFSLTGAGGFYSSYSHPLQVDGSLTVNRTVGGNTYLYNTSGGGVGGAFSYTTVGGNSYLNASGALIVPIGGMISISSPASATFQMYRMKNTLAGGTVAVGGASYLDIRSDTLLATVSFTGYTGVGFIYNNAFTGNTTVSDAAAQNTGSNNIDGNLFNGNFSLTHASASDVMYEGNGGSATGNHVTGNAAFNLTGAGGFFSSYDHPLQVDGSLSVSRTAAGFTNVYNTPGGSVGGSFSYTSSGGDNYINPGNSTTVPVGGSFSVTAPASGYFHMYKMRNGVGGGSVAVAGSNNVDLRNDTLLADVAITGYTSSLLVYDNSITGSTLVADASTQNTSNNYIDGNSFNGAFTLVHSSTSDVAYEGYGSPSGYGNVVTGKDSIVNVAGANTLNVGYNHSHRADATLVLNAASNLAVQSLTFGGSTGGHLRRGGAQPISVPYVYLSKTGGATMTLDNPLSVTNTLTFSSGYIAASAGAPLVFANGAGYTGAGNASHVTGSILKAGNQAFTFPTGTGSVMAAIGITAPSTTTDTIGAAFVFKNPNLDGFDTSAAHRASTLQRVSGCEYWDLAHVSGSSSVAVTLQYGAPCGGVTLPSALRVAHYNGSSWDDLGNSGTTGSSTQGFVTAATAVSSFSPFTLATTNAGANPLPVELSDFTASRLNATALLAWTTQSEKEISAFGIERSANGRDWATIGNVAPGTGIPHTYQFTDEAPLAGTNYYRLRIIERSSAGSYSPVRLVMMGAAGSSVFSVYPNPVTDVLRLSGDVGALRLSNAAGSVMYSGNGSTSIDMRQMPAGIYLLQVAHGSGARETFRILKQ